MTTDLVDPVHEVEILAAREPEPDRLESSPLYGFPLGHWDYVHRIDEV
jgi:hypothetical protein